VPRRPSTAKTESANSKPAPERSRELVDVAARLFRDRGYDATSMQEIADEMGILKGSVYHYVRTKEDLLWMVVEPPLRELVDTARRILEDESIPVVDRLGQAMEAHARSFEVHYPHMFVITRENGETLSPKRREEFDAMRDEYFKIWRAAVLQGRRSGELRDDTDVRNTVQAIFGMLNWMSRWFTPGRRSSAGDVARDFATILARGIATSSR
jgi:AcrR family transcriptional regulator